MRILFILYIVCILVIAIILSLSIIRNVNVYDYREENLNKTGKLNYIPKKIFQLVADKNKIHPDFQENINFIKKMNPDWSYTLFDDQDIIDYIMLHYGQDILFIYNKINSKYGAAKADFFRYLLMYKEGGVYLDIKSSCILPLSSIILPEDEYILCHWDLPTQVHNIKNHDGEFQQWHIICRPLHPFLYAVIEKVIDNILQYDIHKTGVGKQAVIETTGPIAYTFAILPILSKYNHRIVDLAENIGLVYNNINGSHRGLFSKPHYSKIREPVII